MNEGGFENTGPEKARPPVPAMNDGVVVVVPTAAEGAHILAGRMREVFGGKVSVVVGGVGMAVTAATLARLLCGFEGPDGPCASNGSGHKMVILAGIAGVYPAAGDAPCGGLKAGDVVLVATERVADLGAMRGEGFEPLYQQAYHCPYVSAFPALRAVAANTVNCAAAAYVAPRAPQPGTPALAPAQLENMEGAALFAVCTALGVPFLELRAISNVVGEPPEAWNVPLATKNLAAALEVCLQALEAVPQTIETAEAGHITDP